jgi:SH3-like domain-containing protein
VVSLVEKGRRVRAVEEEGEWVRLASGGWAHRSLFAAAAPPPGVEEEPPAAGAAPVPAEAAPVEKEEKPAAGAASEQKVSASIEAAAAASGPDGIAKESDTPASREFTVGVARGRVRGGPSLSAPVLSLAEKGRRVRAVEEKGEWVRLASGGWAHRSLFAAVAPPPGVEEEPPAAAAAPQPGKTDSAGEAAAPNAAAAPEPEAAAPNGAAASASGPVGIEKEVAPPPGVELTVSVDRGKVRSAPSFSAPVMFLVEKNQRYRALEKRGRWYHLLAGKNPGGWAHESLFLAAGGAASGSAAGDGEAPIEPVDSKKAAPSANESKRRIVAVEVGLVRSDPSPEAPVRFRLFGSEEVSVLEDRKGWLRIRRVNGWVGWAHESIFQPARTSPVVPAADTGQPALRTATVGVDVGLVREAPLSDSPRAFRLVKRMKVQVLEEKGDWLQVRLQNGWTGWAHRSLFVGEEPEGHRP